MTDQRQDYGARGCASALVLAVMASALVWALLLLALYVLP